MVISRRLLGRLAGYRDVALALALCAGGEYELFGHVTYEGAPVWPGDRVANAVAIPLLALPLAARRRWPTAVPLAVFAGLALASGLLGGGEATTGFALFIVTTFSAAAHARYRTVCAVAALAAGAVHELRDPHVHGPGDVVWALGMLAIAWLLGTAVRSRQQRIGTLEKQAVEVERRHAEQVSAATAAERAAIARELHDIVAHAVSVIVIQAQAGARALPADTALAREVLERIETSARTALAELRGLTLLADDAPAADVRPAASLTQLDELVDRCRAAGQRIELHVDGPLPALSPVADLAAYRVIQEALTNAVRHAPGATTTVRLRRRGAVLEIDAEDDGGRRRAPAGRNVDGSGRGLIGMRERLALAGGRLLHAEPTGTGFRVTAELPVDDNAATPVQEPIG